MVEKKGKQIIYLMVPKKLIMVLLLITVGQFIAIGASFQYTMYVARQLCGVVKISNDSYKTHPPSSPTGQQLSKEFDRLTKRYHC